MSPSKAEFRKAALQRRAGISPEQRIAFTDRLVGVGLRLVRDFAPANVRLIVSLYSAIDSEPVILPLIEALVAADVPVALPVAFSHGGALEFRLWGPGDPLAPSAMGILEPLPDAPSVDPDVLFVPMVAFDRRGHRIGYGAGHYDRTLLALRASKRVLAVGVAFSVQEELFIPTEPHDQPMDIVVTDRDIILCDS